MGGKRVRLGDSVLDVPYLNSWDALRPCSSSIFHSSLDAVLGVPPRTDLAMRFYASAIFFSFLSVVVDLFFVFCFLRLLASLGAFSFPRTFWVSLNHFYAVSVLTDETFGGH